MIQWDFAAKIPTEKVYIGDWTLDLGGSLAINKDFSFFFGIQATGSLFFDFSSSPIEFNNGLGWGIGIFPGLAAGNYANYCVFGFEEQL